MRLLHFSTLDDITHYCCRAHYHTYIPTGSCHSSITHHSHIITTSTIYYPFFFPFLYAGTLSRLNSSWIWLVPPASFSSVHHDHCWPLIHETADKPHCPWWPCRQHHICQLSSYSLSWQLTMITALGGADPDPGINITTVVIIRVIVGKLILMTFLSGWPHLAVVYHSSLPHPMLPRHYVQSLQQILF